jgi:hypothetical protein
VEKGWEGPKIHPSAVLHPVEVGAKVRGKDPTSATLANCNRVRMSRIPKIVLAVGKEDWDMEQFAAGLSTLACELYIYIYIKVI